MYRTFYNRTKHPVLTRPISNPQNPFSAPKFWSPGRNIDVHMLQTNTTALQCARIACKSPSNGRPAMDVDKADVVDAHVRTQLFAPDESRLGGCRGG